MKIQAAIQVENGRFMSLQYPDVSELDFRAHYQKQDHAQGRKILRFILWVSVPLLYIDYALQGISVAFWVLLSLRTCLFGYSWWVLVQGGRNSNSLQFERHMLAWAISVLVVQLVSNGLSPHSYFGHFFIDAWICIIASIVVPLRRNVLKNLIFGFFIVSMGICFSKTFSDRYFQLMVMTILFLSTYSGQAIATYLYRCRTKLLGAEMELQRKANTDPLTGVANRREFLRVSDSELQRHQRLGKPLSLIVLDLDHLKEISAAHGAEVGDMVLVEVSKRMQRATRNYDCLARYGVEEFSVLLPEATEEVAARIAARTQATIMAMPVAASGKELKVSASIGVATMLKDDTLESMLARAEAALSCARSMAARSVQSEFSLTEVNQSLNVFA
jgi:diguanylate cyclase (GGDEF)-like protein